MGGRWRLCGFGGEVEATMDECVGGWMCGWGGDGVLHVGSCCSFRVCLPYSSKHRHLSEIVHPSGASHGLFLKSSHTSKWSLMCLRRIPQQICPSCRLTLQWTTCLSEQVIVRSDLGSISLGSSLEAPRRCSSASLGTSWLDPPLDPRQPTCLMWTIA